MTFDGQNSTMTIHHCSEHYIGYVPLELYQAAGVPKPTELDYEENNEGDNVEQIVMMELNE